MKKIYILIAAMFFAGGVFAQCSLTLGGLTSVSCYGGSDGTATVVGTGGAPPYSYSWSPSGQTTATVSNLSVGSYTVTATDINSCVATTTVTITEPPQLNIIITTTNASNSTTCDGSVSALVSGGFSPYSYIWLPGGQTTSAITGQCAGTYSLQISDSLGCIKNDSTNSIGITGLEEIFSPNVVDIFPNPSIGQFSISFNKQISDAKVSVTNIVGQEVFQSAITNLKMEIDITQQPKGIYFVQVVNEKTVLTGKLIKE